MTDINDTADVRIHYCKSKKHTGKPIVVNPIDSDEYDTDNFEMNDVNVRVKFNNAVSKEKASGATSILEVRKPKHIEDNNTLMYKSIRTRESAYNSQCISCGHDFEIGVKRIHWRLKLQRSIFFHNGSFTTSQCRECALRTTELWIDSLRQMREKRKDE